MADDDEPVPGKWLVRMTPDGDTTIHDAESDELIATIHGSRDDRLHRALLIARAPTLRDAADAMLQMMRLMQDHPDPRVHETAQDFIPVLESALYLTRED